MKYVMGIALLIGVLACERGSQISPSKKSFASRVLDTTRHRSRFHGYDCHGDCSGHLAGYNWADEKNIDDPDECHGNSQSFKEGCLAYVYESVDEGPDPAYRN